MAEFSMRTSVGDAIWQNGGTITDSYENPSQTLFDRKAREAIQWLVDLRHKLLLAPSVEEQRALPKHPFRHGTGGDAVGTILVLLHHGGHQGLLVGRGFIPRGPDGKQASTTSTNHYAAFRQAASPSAWKLVYYMTAEGLRTRAEPRA